jgi:hypothetical protein
MAALTQGALTARSIPIAVVFVYLATQAKAGFERLKKNLRE